MTFGIAFVGPGHAGVVTDRRLSGRRKTDDSTKCGIATFQDGSLAYTMAGLAEVATFRTRYWIAETVVRAAAPGLSMEAALRRFTDEATATMRELRLPRTERRLSVAFVGHRRHPLGLHECVVAQVSNFGHFDEDSPGDVWDEFRLSFKSAPMGATAILTVGCGQIAQSDLDHAAELVRNPKVPPSEIVNVLVGLIRRAAALDPNGAIGDICSSVVISAGNPSVGYDYHPQVASPISRIPAMACAIYGNTGAYVAVDGAVEVGRLDGGTAVAHVPRGAKGGPCGCGSGRKYKRCHGRGGRSAVPDTVEVGMDVMVIAPPADGSDLMLLSL